MKILLDNTQPSRRAWAEIDLDALCHNIRVINHHLPHGCELMACVKSDAYGHGITQVARRLWGEGVRSFAVATAQEGAALRRCGVKGSILVLGYTPFSDAKILSRNNLEQLIVDGAHAKALNDARYRLRVHVAIDTGMHRLGIDAKHIDEIESVFQYEYLTVVGIASHLASSDSFDEDDVDFTNSQIKRFYETAGALQEKGYDTGKLHIQSSYGILNYSELQCDFARAGIMLYGVLSNKSKTKIKPDLRPVLSLYSKVVQTRWIDEGEAVSYGRIYKASKPTRVAVVSIGYADGIPRHMAGSRSFCLINGRKAPIIGRICMDFLMVDITDIESVVPGDIVTLIGRDGELEIKCEDFAAAAKTISNEIFCSLGNRVERIYIS